MDKNIQIYIQRIRLPLKKPFKLSHGTYTFRENLFFIIRYKSFYGIGEAPVVPYYGHTIEMIESDLKKMDSGILLSLLESTGEEMYNWDIPVQTMPARCAVETALISLLSHLAGKECGIYMGVTKKEIAPTSCTVSGNTVKEVIEDAQSSPSTILKVKAGVGDDYSIIHMLRNTFPRYTLRIDVNRGWPIQKASHRIAEIDNLNIELIEEPVRGSFHEIEQIAKESPVPIFIDESFQDMEDLYRMRDKAPSVRGIVVKLAKSGGPLKALSLIHTAQNYGLLVMISSMVESSVGVSVAASIAPRCKYVDLDSPFLLEEDPFHFLDYNGNIIQLRDNTYRRKKIMQFLAELPVDK